jgi:hypothetical protein
MPCQTCRDQPAVDVLPTAARHQPPSSRLLIKRRTAHKVPPASRRRTSPLTLTSGQRGDCGYACELDLSCRTLPNLPITSWPCPRGRRHARERQRPVRSRRQEPAWYVLALLRSSIRLNRIHPAAAQADVGAYSDVVRSNREALDSSIRHSVKPQACFDQSCCRWFHSLS